MKKVLIVISSVVNVILLGIAFGLGALPAGYYPEPEHMANQSGNFYQFVWRSEYETTVGFIMNLIIFFLFCICAVAVLVSCFPFKKRFVFDVVVSALLIVTGVLLFFVPTFLYMGGTQFESYGIGEGIAAMAILTLVAGLINVFKVILDFKEEF